MNDWKKAQAWEKDWWNLCLNTYFEEMKQLLYANRMGLVTTPDAKTPYRFDLGGIKVIDIGGGPCSLLLKCVNVQGAVIDPLDFPKWVLVRYQMANIHFRSMTAESLVIKGFDEAWIYNALQHVKNPELVIANACRASNLIRLFEWIDTPPNEGHPNTLTEVELNSWLGGEGKVETFTGQHGCKGKAYYGIFPT